MNREEMLKNLKNMKPSKENGGMMFEKKVLSEYDRWYESKTGNKVVVCECGGVFRMDGTCSNHNCNKKQ